MTAFDSSVCSIKTVEEANKRWNPLDFLLDDRAAGSRSDDLWRLWRGAP